ncbi:zinc knuckle protein [Rutstroemia sp. NJR-2017a BBW]|nr:zinc knuckle protein [Rutstroemia sp. NJR-2017a BBW]
MSASAGTPTSAPKAMSSRLLTMKFMQRAAASSPTSPSTSTLEEPSPKRQKMAHTTPTKFNVDSLADNRAIRAALEEEEAKKQAALDRAAAEAGDTRWVLSFEDRKHLDKPTNTLRVVQAGFANLDLPSPIQAHSGYDDVAVEDKPAMKQQNPNQEDSSSSSEDSEDESEDDFDGKDDDDPTGANELIKASQKEAAKRAKEERKAKKKAEKAELLELAKKRKKKHVSLNGLTSLSGQDNKACYGCGGNHLQKDCPKKRRHQGEDGPPRKSQRTR